MGGVVDWREELQQWIWSWHDDLAPLKRWQQGDGFVGGCSEAVR